MSSNALALVLIILTGLAGCSRPEVAGDERFPPSGELVAMSGGAAGAGNACFTCHGLDGAGNGAAVPRLAGLDPGYLQHQMQAFADGRRRHPEMQWIAGKLTPAERIEVSLYYAGLQPPSAQSGRRPAQAPAIYFEGAPDRGLAPCASCHGADGQGIGAAPALAGQPAPYLALQIDHWKRGTRRSDPGGEMLAIAQKLTPSEASAVAAYASVLPPGSPRRQR